MGTIVTTAPDVLLLHYGSKDGSHQLFAIHDGTAALDKVVETQPPGGFGNARALFKDPSIFSKSFEDNHRSADQ